MLAPLWKNLLVWLWSVCWRVLPTVVCHLPRMITHKIHIYSSVFIQLPLRRKLCPFPPVLGGKVRSPNFHHKSLFHKKDDQRVNYILRCLWLDTNICGRNGPLFQPVSTSTSVMSKFFTSIFVLNLQPPRPFNCSARAQTLQEWESLFLLWCLWQRNVHISTLKCP